jgi:hypothetical protein
MLRLWVVRRSRCLMRRCRWRCASCPADLAALDELLSDPTLLAPIEDASEQAARGHGRPTLAMATYVRLIGHQAAHRPGL